MQKKAGIYALNECISPGFFVSQSAKIGFYKCGYISPATTHTIKPVMYMKKFLPYAVFLLLTFAVGGLSSLAVTRGLPVYEQLVKPPLTPPSLVFPIVWSILYFLMAVGAARVWRTHSPARGKAMARYAVQLVLNFGWSIWFFGLHAHFFAFVWLLALIAAIGWMMQAFYPIDRAASWMQVPYLLWCLFAAYLNFGIWILNT